MSVVICVPWRGDEGHRDRAWAWCSARWERHVDWPIVTGDSDPTRPFNRSAARNAAAALAGDWEVAVFTDADCILREPAPLTRAVALALLTGHAVLPHSRYFSLTERGTEQVYRGRASGWDMAMTIRLSTAIGGVIVVPRSLWDQVGGYDERFTGWGAEDGAMVDALRTFGIVERVEGTLYQLWHPPAARKFEEYRHNKPLRRRYRAARHDQAAMGALIAERQEAAA